MPIDRRDKLVLGIILILTIGIRILFLSHPIAFDEATTYINYATRPLVEAISNYSAPNNHLFHTLLVHLAIQFGHDEWIIRLPAFLAGVALVPVTYLLGRRLYNADTGLLAAALVAASSALIEYSTNARGYTLLTLFSLLSMLTSTYLMERESRWLWVLFALLAALGAYTIPIMLYPVAGTAVWLGLTFIVRGQPERLLSLIMAGIATAGVTLLFYLPVLLYSGAEAVIANAFVRPRTWEQFLYDLPISLERTWLLWNRDVPLPLQVVLVIGVIIALIRHRQLSHFHNLLIVVPTAGLLVLMGRVAPFSRVWLWLLPVIFIVSSAGIIWLLERITATRRFVLAPILTIALCVGLCANIAIVRSDEPFGDIVLEPESENVVIFLKSHFQPNDDYLLIPASGALSYYFAQHSLSFEHLGDNLPQITAPRLLIIVLEPDYTLDSMLALLSSYGLNAAPYTTRERIAQFKRASLWELRRAEP